MQSPRNHLLHFFSAPAAPFALEKLCETCILFKSKTERQCVHIFTLKVLLDTQVDVFGVQYALYMQLGSQPFLSTEAIVYICIHHQCRKIC